MRKLIIKILLLIIITGFVIVLFLNLREKRKIVGGDFTKSFYYDNLRSYIISNDSSQINLILNENFTGEERLIRFICLNNNITELELYHIHRYWFPGRIEFGTTDLTYFNKGEVLRYYVPDSCSQYFNGKSVYQVPVKMMDLLKLYINKNQLKANYINWERFKKDYPLFKCYIINNHTDSLEYLISVKDSIRNMLIYYFYNQENYLVAETKSNIEKQYFEDIKKFKKNH